MWQVGAATLTGARPVLRGDESCRVGHGADVPADRDRAWLECYTAAIPYFRNSLAGDCAFTAILFGGLAWLESRVAWMRETAPPVLA